MPAKIELTRVQRDCLDAKGICDGCPNNILESGPCQVKYSKGVAKKLGFREKVPSHGVSKLKQPETKTCGFCGETFEAWYGSARYCTPCASKRPRDTWTVRICKGCESKYWGLSPRRYCDGCREERASA